MKIKQIKIIYKSKIKRIKKKIVYETKINCEIINIIIDRIYTS